LTGKYKNSKSIIDVLKEQEYAVGDAFNDEVNGDKLGGFIEKVSHF